MEWGVEGISVHYSAGLNFKRVINKYKYDIQ